ncbi:hypothetical protein ACWDFR_39835 [Streptomyces sp. 900105755]|uniref:hypothetical protein n=1 Tax=Streptomyces sp. NPDC001507 TaxID=3364579 RepID=UPI003693A045
MRPSSLGGYSGGRNSGPTSGKCAGHRRYLGPVPPPGSGPDRYFLVVHAVDAEEQAQRPTSTCSPRRPR